MFIENIIWCNISISKISVWCKSIIVFFYYYRRYSNFVDASKYAIDNEIIPIHDIDNDKNERLLAPLVVSGEEQEFNEDIAKYSIGLIRFVELTVEDSSSKLTSAKDVEVVPSTYGLKQNVIFRYHNRIIGVLGTDG